MSQDAINLTVEKREVIGKAVKHLRATGKVPAVIHDHGKASILVQGDSVAMVKVWRQAGKHHPVNLKAADKNYVALIKTAEFDPKKHLLTHIVFQSVNATEKVEAEVPIRARYSEGNDASPAERAGLMVLAQLEAVVVEAIATKLPDVLEYDAEKLVNVGDHLTVADLHAPDGVEIKTEATHSIVAVYEPSAMQAANDAAGGDAAEDTTVAADNGSDEVADAPTDTTGDNK